jgi:hypothetical protein
MIVAWQQRRKAGLVAYPGHPDHLGRSPGLGRDGRASRAVPAGAHDERPPRDGGGLHLDRR